jgi:hypothetical protein
LSCRFQSIAENTYRAICLRLYCIFSYQFVGSESCVRLLDVDGDGILDVLFSAATSQDISGVLSDDKLNMKQFCKNKSNYNIYIVHIRA